jgi:hypothetical protein
MLISHLPARNTILTTKIIQQYSDAKAFIEKYKEKINRLVDQPGQIENIINYSKKIKSVDNNDMSAAECQCDEDLFQFIDKYFDWDCIPEIAEEKFKEDVKNALKKFSLDLKGDFDEDMIKRIEQESDRIFYSDAEDKVNIRTVDAIGDDKEEGRDKEDEYGCGTYIKNNEKYKKYSEEFSGKIKLPIIAKKYLTTINHHFEQKFIDNDFNSLFPYGGYSNIFEKILSDLPNGEDKTLLISNSDVIVKILPIFKMFSMYGEILKKLLYKQNGDIMMRFDFNPFNAAFYRLLKKVRMDVRHFGLSSEFCERYFMNDDWWSPDLYTIIPRIIQLSSFEGNGLFSFLPISWVLWNTPL